MSVLREPEFMKKNYAYINKKEEWTIKDDAPEWAKKEFYNFMKLVNPESDEDGIVTHF